MRKVGPLKCCSTRKYESKHKESKNYASVNRSRLNSPYSLLLKHQLNLNYRFIQNKGFGERLRLGVVLTEGLNLIENYNKFKHFIDNSNVEKLRLTSWIEVYGTRYQSGLIIITEKKECSLSFGKIQHTFFVDNDKNQVFFTYTEVKVSSIVEHMGAFEVYETNKWGFISQQKLITHKTLGMHRLSDNKYYISTIPM